MPQADTDGAEIQSTENKSMQESIFSEIAGVIRKRLRSKKKAAVTEEKKKPRKKEKKDVESAYINPVAE